MAGPETDSAKPKPEAAKTSAAGGGDATRYVGTPAVGTSKAAAAAGLATVGPEPSEINRKRRRLVWVTVTGFLGAWFIAFFKFFLPRSFQDRLRLGLRVGRGYKVAAEISHLGGPHAGSRVCHLRPLHALGLHARLESRRKQIQVPLPRQRIRQRRCQFRGTSSASDGPRARGTRARRSNHRGHFPALPVAQGTTKPFQRSGVIFAGVTGGVAEAFRT